MSHHVGSLFHMGCGLLTVSTRNAFTVLGSVQRYWWLTTACTLFVFMPNKSVKTEFLGSYNIFNLNIMLLQEGCKICYTSF